MKRALALTALLACGGSAFGFADPAFRETKVPFKSGAFLIVRAPVGTEKPRPADEPNGFPSLVWFHGGGLTKGHAGHGVFGGDLHLIQVLVEYRLMSPSNSVRAAECIHDAAEAIAWTLDHIAEYGGDPRRVYVSGHSAGGYLTMITGMDPRHLAAFGHRPTDLAGLIPISGQATKHFNVRNFEGDTRSQYFPVIDDLAPLAHVTNAIPPMLVVCGQPPHEWKGRAEENRFLVATLNALGDDKAWYVEAPGCDHGTVGEVAEVYVRDFIRGRFVPAQR